MMYINKADLYPLQYLLYQMLTSITGLRDAASKAGLVVADMPDETFKMAMAVITTGPIILLYPFVQKYFVKGLTVGSVKG
jgi:putative aldouronate transport system permease protein